jgi:putative DNA primase/helicase
MTNLRERCNGRWYGILTALGVHSRYLLNKHGPCPICGGKDRFRWDNKNGDGTYFCNQCGAGSGVDLVMKLWGLPFRDAALRIEQVIGDACPEPHRPARSEAARRAGMNALWLEGKPLRRDDPVDRWFRRRAINVEVYPAVLRCVDRVRYISPTQPASYHPAMLAMVMAPDGTPATLHKTYLTAQGEKAPVCEPRKFCEGTIPWGASVRLAAPNNGMIAVAEGIETAFAAMMLFGIPCWAALNAGMLEKFQPPDDVKQLVVYADNDVNQVGQRAAWSLASRLGSTTKVNIKIPNEAGTDWNDVLMKGGAE